MTFLAKPRGYAPAEFHAFVSTLKWDGWKPTFVVLHNTADPNLAKWMGVGDELHYVNNLNHYYKTGKHWHSGPHLFVSPTKIWNACDLLEDGVHASCWDDDAFGVEMVGDYAHDAFNRGLGAQVRDNAVAAVASLNLAIGARADTLRFHKECKEDHHDCPGKNVDKADMIRRIGAAMQAYVNPDVS